MELLTGYTLGQVIKAGGPIPAARAVRIIKQVAGALSAAHAEGVVHRDLKPDNVFLTGGGALEPAERGRAAALLGEVPDVRVVDFGAAKIIGSSRMTRTGIVFGTPHYMSPEQASGASIDHRTDIYALGIIMYEMFTGRVPFEADTYMGVLTQHMFVQPVPPSQASEAARELGALEQITLICLEKKAEDRFGSMNDLVQAIDRVVRVDERGGVDIAPRLEGSPSRAPASVRYRMADELEPPTLEEMRVAIDSELPSRRPVQWRWLGVAAGAIFVVGAAIWALSARRPSETTSPPVPSSAAVGVIPAATVIPMPPSASPTPSALPSEPPFSASAPAPPPRPPVRKAPPRRPAPAALDDVGDPFASKR